jgi:hypothetical protein
MRNPETTKAISTPANPPTKPVISKWKETTASTSSARSPVMSGRSARQSDCIQCRKSAAFIHKAAMQAMRKPDFEQFQGIHIPVLSNMGKSLLTIN